MNSTGALTRMSMSAIAGVVFFFFKKRWKNTYKDSNLWMQFSVTVFLIPISFHLINYS